MKPIIICAFLFSIKHTQLQLRAPVAYDLVTACTDGIRTALTWGPLQNTSINTLKSGRYSTEKGTYICLIKVNHASAHFGDIGGMAIGGIASTKHDTARLCSVRIGFIDFVTTSC